MSITVGSVFVIFAVFILSNVPFGFLDLTGWPQSLVQYKMQEDKAVPVSCSLSVAIEWYTRSVLSYGMPDCACMYMSM